MALSPVQQKLTEFLVTADESVVDHFTLDFNVMPPLLVYQNDEKFIALDPAGNKFYIDPNYNFGHEYNFSAEPTIQTKVDKWGKAIWSKAQADYTSKWLASF